MPPMPPLPPLFFLLLILFLPSLRPPRARLVFFHQLFQGSPSFAASRVGLNFIDDGIFEESHRPQNRVARRSLADNCIEYPRILFSSFSAYYIGLRSRDSDRIATHSRKSSG
jgi:hypothetical protein